MDGVNRRSFLRAGKWKRLYHMDGKLLTSKLSGNPLWFLILLLTILLKTKPLIIVRKPLLKEMLLRMLQKILALIFLVPSPLQ